MTPRLLSQEKTAELLGASRSWFSQHRLKLELRGFPPPVLQHNEFGGARWDSKSINAWLDNLMPAGLKNKIDIKRNVDDYDICALEAEMTERAHNIAAGCA